MFLASINCPNDNPHDYIKNLKDDNCFQNIIALEKNEEKKFEIVNYYINCLFEYLKGVNMDSVDMNAFVSFDIISNYYPANYDKEYIKSLSKIAEVALGFGAFNQSLEYYNKLLLYDNQNAKYYWNRMLASLSCKNEDELIISNNNITENNDYNCALKYGNADEVSLYLDCKKKWQDNYDKYLETERIKKEELEKNKRLEIEKQKQEEEKKKKQLELENQKKEKLERERLLIIEKQKQEQLNQNLRLAGIVICIVLSLIIAIISIVLQINTKYSDANGFTFFMMIVGTLISAGPYFIAYKYGSDNSFNFRKWLNCLYAYPIILMFTIPWLDLPAVILYLIGELVIQIIGTLLFYQYGKNK